MKLPNRNLLNADCNAYFYSSEIWQPEGGKMNRNLIHNMIKYMADQGIDTFLMNPNGQKLYCPSKALDYIHKNYTRNGRDFFRAQAICENVPADRLEDYFQYQFKIANAYLDLEEAGINWFGETAIACRKYGISPWISIRMNDTHGGNQPEKSYMNADFFKKDPSVRQPKPSINPDEVIERYAFDYGKKEVRDYMFSMIRECIEEYDYEGIELDFLRDPIILKPVASQEEIDTMTDWFHEIKKLARKKSIQTGRPFPVGIRTPAHLNLMRDMGVDIRGLVSKKILDFVVFGNYYQTSWDMPHDELRKELGDDVTIYGSIDGAINWLRVRSEKSLKTGGYLDGNLGDRPTAYSAEFIRGNAVTKLVLGADGVEQFNNFFGWDNRMGKPPAGEALPYLYDLEFLRGKPKYYTLSSQFRSAYTTVPYETTEHLPEWIEPRSRRSFRIPMCKEELDSGLKKVKVQVIVEQKENMVLGVSFNEGWPNFEAEIGERLLCPCGKYVLMEEGHVGYTFTFPLTVLREGYNEIAVFNWVQLPANAQERIDRTIRVMSVEVSVE